ncbi:MAG: J domain-containing protein [Acidobacteriota bacterium]|nr:MAG: J domain-containing protein [Acidobacteriota bacterium]
MATVAPEEIELQKKQRVLERLKDRLADREEAMTDLRGEMEQFEAKYTMEVARLYAEFDEIEAQIAEEEFKLVPDDEEIKKRAEELRRRAEESAARAAEDAEKANFRHDPTPEAKKAYHELARAIHPDLALDNEEKERRHVMMAELNDAYSRGDQQKLNKLVADMRQSPEMVRGDSVGDELIRVIRTIYQVNQRLRELAAEEAEVMASELYGLKQNVDREMAEGRDILSQMANRTQVHIKKSERRLANLRQVNEAQEEYVRERFGMDVEDFRQKKQ